MRKKLFTAYGKEGPELVAEISVLPPTEDCKVEWITGRDKYEEMILEDYFGPLKRKGLSPDGSFDPTKYQHWLEVRERYQSPGIYCEITPETEEEKQNWPWDEP